MPPKGKVATNQELQERIELLEAGRKLKIADLPMDALKRELRKEPQNPTELLLPGSIGPGLLTGLGAAVTYTKSFSATLGFTGTTLITVTQSVMEIPRAGTYFPIAYGDVTAAAGNPCALFMGANGAAIGPQHIWNNNLRTPLMVAGPPTQLKANSTVHLMYQYEGVINAAFLTAIRLGE